MRVVDVCNAHQLYFWVCSRGRHCGRSRQLNRQGDKDTVRLTTTSIFLTLYSIVTSGVRTFGGVVIRHFDICPCGDPPRRTNFGCAHTVELIAYLTVTFLAQHWLDSPDWSAPRSLKNVA